MELTKRNLLERNQENYMNYLILHLMTLGLLLLWVAGASMRRFSPVIRRTGMGRARVH